MKYLLFVLMLSLSLNASIKVARCDGFGSLKIDIEIEGNTLDRIKYKSYELVYNNISKENMVYEKSADVKIIDVVKNETGVLIELEGNEFDRTYKTSRFFELDSISISHGVIYITRNGAGHRWLSIYDECEFFNMDLLR